MVAVVVPTISKHNNGEQHSVQTRQLKVQRILKRKNCGLSVRAADPVDNTVSESDRSTSDSDDDYTTRSDDSDFVKLPLKKAVPVMCFMTARARTGNVLDACHVLFCFLASASSNASVEIPLVGQRF
ncbi:hypothetical protein EMCG_03750 [[Emmonsia] crescens]|uniref:Uncharacterized protein n=1 Tax=[Emmonsia] crescens TaxID=73230 RepID=A0A0G2J871_9EURO|nr:hypothetical protein EMCG_03750 [Emmonsia crescens UAMH 3008]